MNRFGRSIFQSKLFSRALSGAVTVSLFALSACSPGALSNAVPSFSNAASSSSGATRTVSEEANAGYGSLAMPGGGSLGMPGGGSLAMPGGDLLGIINLSILTNLLGGLLSPCAVVGLVVGQAQCNALLNPMVPVNPNPNLVPSQISGFHPSDLRSAYNIPSGGSGHIVATVVAGDDPTAENDLGIYRHAFGMTACTTANACFHKVNQSGAAGSYPAAISGWPQEAGIDIEMISAICPSCTIVLVEANSAQISDLAASVDTAVNLGATVVNNSYYAPEYNGELTDEQHFNHPGVAMTASAGDVGYGATFPAASRYVTAVGGTSLARTGLLGLLLTGWSQTVWGATGSGCSTYVPKPSWQTDTGCTMRTLNDVAVVGDPLTGVSVYNSTAPSGQVGWGVYGGTSVSAPIVAGMYALSGNAGSIDAASYAYAHTGSFKSVTRGSNGQCTPSYLCNGGYGYNGPAGLGTPSGDGGF